MVRKKIHSSHCKERSVVKSGWFFGRGFVFFFAFRRRWKASRWTFRLRSYHVLPCPYLWNNVVQAVVSDSDHFPVCLLHPFRWPANSREPSETRHAPDSVFFKHLCVHLPSSTVWFCRHKPSGSHGDGTQMGSFPQLDKQLFKAQKTFISPLRHDQVPRPFHQNLLNPQWSHIIKLIIQAWILGPRTGRLTLWRG